MKNFVCGVFWLFLALLTLGRIKRAVANSEHPIRGLNRIYKAGGLRALLFMFGPITGFVVCFANNWGDAGLLCLAGVPIGFILLALTEPSPKP